MLKDVQYNPKSNFNLFSVGKAMKEGWKLSGDQKVLALKGCSKLVFNIKIMTKNVEMFCACLWREYEITPLLASTEKAHMITRHHDEE